MLRHALLVAGMLAAIAIAATAQRFATPHRTYTLEETERLVKADLATMVRGTVADVTVAERSGEPVGRRRHVRHAPGRQRADGG